jgi:Flp pilus assembly protein TadB
VSHDTSFFNDYSCRHHPRRNLLVTSLNSDSSLSGVIGIIVGVLVVSAVIQFVTHSLLHWVAVIAAIAVGIMAVKAING